MSDESQGAFSIIPEGFYDLIGILVPGVAFLGAIVLLELPRLDVAAPTEWPQLFGFLLASYVVGHLLYSLSALALPKVADRFGNPRRDLVLPGPSPKHNKLYQHFVFEPEKPGEDNDLAARIRTKWQLITESVPDHALYELCRGYVHVNSKERANFIRKEQAYGELARSLVLALLVISALAWLSPFSFADKAICSVSALLSSLVFFWRYLHARQIDAVMVYYTFFVLRQEELEQISDLRHSSRRQGRKRIEANGVAASVCYHQMMRKHLVFEFPHGVVEGMLVSPAGGGPLVIITNGHDGFYSYGMFPYIQDALADAGISSYSYNFSHGGVKNGEDHFSDLAAYEKNCMRLEKEDLLQILKNVGKLSSTAVSSGVFLFSHSLGSVPTVFAAHDLVDGGVEVQGVILVAPIKTLNVFPREMMEEWEQTGTYHMKNNRTNQDLPQGSEFLEEIKASEKAWNIERVFKRTPTHWLLIHGSEDGDVPVEHSETLVRWAKEVGFDVTLEVVNKAGHTFNTKHPFEGPTPELDELVRVTQEWIHRISSA